jgi:hypothetical protein
MATKKVTVNITSHPLSREENGVNFDVSTEDGKLGELIVSKGGLRWKPKGKQDHHFMRWGQFDALAREYPKK